MSMPGIEPWDCRDLPLFRDCAVLRMRREYTIAAGQPPAVASIIPNKVMKCVAAILCFWGPSQAAYSAQPEHSISTSRQFVIYGADAKVRGAISGLAEET